MSRISEFALTIRALWLGIAVLSLSGMVPHAGAQVIQIDGGNSSLYQAGGGSISLHAPGYNASLGAGMVGGHFSYGAKLETMIGKTVLTTGDEQIDILLPTDVFDASHYVYGRGVGIATKLDGLDLFAFGGTTSTFYETPIFQGARWGGGMGALAIRKTLSPKWQLWSDTIIRDKMTQIVAAQWTPQRKFRLAASAGVGANHPYFASSVNLSRKYLDVLGSYVAESSDFRRVAVSTPIQAEPDKANLLVTLKPTSYLTVSGGTQHFQVPNQTTKTVEASSVRSASVGLQVARAMLSGTVYDSSAMQQSNHAAVLMASREFTSRVRIMSSYMVSKPQDSKGSSSFFTTFTETLNQHLSVNQNVSTSNGQTNLYYGGSLLTNLMTISATYENFYIPVQTANPFKQSLMLDVSLHLFGRLNLHGATIVGPTGKTLYTATGNTVAVHGQSDQNGQQMFALGKSVLRVLVVDGDNRPVEGAALMIDGKEVFTGPDGTFSMRERKERSHSLDVMIDQFIDGAVWQVQSVPPQIRSSENEDDPGAVIVVRRIPVVRRTQPADPNVQDSAAVSSSGQAGPGQ